MSKKQISVAEFEKLARGAAKDISIAKPPKSFKIDKYLDIKFKVGTTKTDIVVKDITPHFKFSFMTIVTPNDAYHFKAKAKDKGTYEFKIPKSLAGNKITVAECMVEAVSKDCVDLFLNKKVFNL